MRMNTSIELDGFSIEVSFKRIRRMHLSVGPDAVVRMSAPERTSLATLREFATSKLDWLRKHRAAFLAHPRETGRAYVDGEGLPVWGKDLLLVVEETQGRPRFLLSEDRALLRIKPGADRAAREKLVEAWYKKALLEAARPLVELWQTRLGVRVGALSVRRMKTKWGSCFPAKARIGLNSELAKRPPEYLEYVLVHELVHLLEPDHGPGFRARMDRWVPDWRDLRDRLNHPERFAGGDTPFP
jgi:predicted metal-dependent hydrolase